MNLRVPRTRDGKFSPTVFERYHRNEKALLASMLEMYISGVSTRKASQIVEELCGKTISKSFVSELTAQLNPMVKEWQHRSLSDTTFPYLMVDVLYIKVREEHRVVSKSCHIALGVGVSWQRCQVHFMRNILSMIPKKDSKSFRESVKAIFQFTDISLEQQNGFQFKYE